MKRIWSLVIFIIIAVAGSKLNAMGNHPRKMDKYRADSPVLSEAPVIDVMTAYQLWLGKKAVFVNALSARSYAMEHIPGSVNIPSSAPRNALSQLRGLPKDTILISYCAYHQCHAADATAQFLKDNGYTQVFVFRAGMHGWKAQGFPVEK